MSRPGLASPIACEIRCAPVANSIGSMVRSIRPRGRVHAGSTRHRGRGDRRFWARRISRVRPDWARHDGEADIHAAVSGNAGSRTSNSPRGVVWGGGPLLPLDLVQVVVVGEKGTPTPPLGSHCVCAVCSAGVDSTNQRAGCFPTGGCRFRRRPPTTLPHRSLSRFASASVLIVAVGEMRSPRQNASRRGVPGPAMAITSLNRNGAVEPDRLFPGVQQIAEKFRLHVGPFAERIDPRRQDPHDRAK